MTISDIRKTDEALSQIVGDVHLQIPHALQGTPVETTAVVLSSLVNGLVSLKSGILDLAEDGNIYGAFVLFRVFLEHVLKTNAIFMKAVTDHSEEFAEQYLLLRVKEAYDYLRACEQAGIPIGGDRKSVLDQWIPEAQAMSANKVKDLDSPFRYRTLIATIRDLIGSTSPDFLSKVIPNYSELSGFVHGGPTAQAKLALIHQLRSAEAELCHVADLSVAMLYSAHRWLLMLASHIRPDFQQTYEQLNGALTKQNGQSDSKDINSS